MSMTRREEIARLVNDLVDAAGDDYWQKDQGYRSADIEAAADKHKAARVALDAAIDALALPAQAGPHDELVKRLETLNRRYIRKPECKQTLTEAASIITQQAAEIERFNAEMSKANDAFWTVKAERDEWKKLCDDGGKVEVANEQRAEKAEAERDDYKHKLDEAVKALEPFAEAEDHLGDRMPDSSSSVMFYAVGINTGNFRRARAVLSRLAEGK